MHSFSWMQPDERYADVLKDMFALMVWLYKDFLNQKTSVSENDFDWDKVEKKPVEYIEVPEPEETAEKLIENLKKVLPDWDVDKACVVSEETEYVVLKDRNGNVVGKYRTQSDFDSVQKNKEELSKEKLLLEKDIAKKTRQYDKAIKNKDEEIDALQRKLNQIEDTLFVAQNENEQPVQRKDELQSDLDQRVGERDKLAKALIQAQKQYGERIQALEIQLEEKGIGYDNAVEEIKKLIQEKAVLNDEYEKKNEKLQEEIHAISRELATAKNNADLYQSANQEASELINDLEKRLKAKEKELDRQNKVVGEWMNELNEEQKVYFRAFRSGEISLDTLLMNLVVGNQRIKNDFNTIDKKDDKAYLQVIRRDVARMNNSYAVYVQQPNRSLLRQMLLKIKEMYDAEIEKRDAEIERIQKEWMETERLHSDELERERMQSQEKIEKERSEREKVEEQLNLEREEGRRTKEQLEQERERAAEQLKIEREEREKERQQERERERLENEAWRETIREVISDRNYRSNRKKNNFAVWLLKISIPAALLVLIWCVVSNSRADQKANNKVSESVSDMDTQNVADLSNELNEYIEDSTDGVADNLTEIEPINETGENFETEPGNEVEEIAEGKPENEASEEVTEQSAEQLDDQAKEDGSSQEEESLSSETNTETNTETDMEANTETDKEINAETETEANTETNTESNEKNPLELAKEERDRLNALPKSLDEIPGINTSLAAFVREYQYLDWFQTGYEGAEFLAEAYSRHVVSQREKYYTYDGYSWLSFCAVRPKNPYYGGAYYFFLPSELSSSLNENSTKQDFIDLLGEPIVKKKTEVSDFSFRMEVDNPYEMEWDYDDAYEKAHRVRIYAFVDDQGVFDYCELYVN